MTRLKTQYKTNNISKKYSNLKNIYFIIISIILFSAVNAQDFWMQTNGPSGGIIHALIVSRDNHILACTDGGGIFRSTNDGDEWMFSGMANSTFQSIVVDTNNYIYAGGYEGVFRSDNNGLSWIPVNNGLTNTDVQCMVVNTNNHVFAGTWDGGVFRSDDQGANWIQINNNLTNTIVISLERNLSGHLFAGTKGGGIFRSVDNGDTWVAINSGLSNLEILSLNFKHQNGFVFAGTLDGVFRSGDNGDNWIQINNGLTTTNVFSIIINLAGDIMAGTDDGIFRSNNDGNDWIQINNGVTSNHIHSFALKDGNLIFAGTYDGVFRTSNNGNYWDQVNDNLNVSIANSFVMGENGGIFVGTEGGGVFRSYDMGMNWEQHNIGLFNHYILDLEINNTGQLFAGTYGGVFRSYDNGNYWTQINTNLTSFNVYTLSVNENNHIFAGTYDGVFRSINNGDSWTQINNGMVQNHVNSIEINRDNMIFAGCDSGGFYRSTDNGDNWTLVTSGLTNTDILDIVIQSDNVLFAASYEGVYRSGDNGSNWFQVNNGLTSPEVFALAIDYRDHIYAGTYEGVFVTADNGNNWYPVNSGLTNLDIFALELHPSGFLFAGSYGSGVFKSSERVSLARPELIEPVSGQANVQTNPILRWYEVDGANTYEVQVDDQPTFSTIDWSNSLSDTVVQTSLLNPDQTYYWRVNASDGVNTSFWSIGGHFTTMALPSLTTQNATNITDVSAQLNAMVNPNNVKIGIGFEYGETSSYGYYVQATPDTLSNASTSPVSAYIGGLFTDRDYHFRVVAHNADGSLDVFGDGHMFHSATYPTNIDISSPTMQFPFHDDISNYNPQDYRIVGVPGGVIAKSFEEILGGTHGADWQVYNDNGVNSGNPDDYLVEFNGSNEFQFGDGNAFWILKKGDLKIQEFGIATVGLNMNEEAEIQLHQGWNLITNPFDRPIEWWRIQQINTNIGLIYTYDGTDNWPNSDNQFTNFEPYVGYYIDSPGNMVLRIPYGSTMAKPLSKPIYSWQVDILLSTNGSTESSTRIGVSEQSHKNRDNLDYRKPRSIGNIPSVYLSRPEWNEDYEIFYTDIRPKIDDVEIWDFTVSGTENKKTTITFTGIDDIPAQNEVYLLDKMNSNYVNLRINSEYNFVPATNSTNLSILVGNKNSIIEEIENMIPNEFVLGKNFPNPFNPTTIIPVTIPKESELTLKVYNVLGQEIITIFDGTKDAGKHYFRWDGSTFQNQQVAAGVYLYKLTTDQGHNFVEKMVLVK